VNQHQRFLQWRANVIGELDRRSPGAALAAVHHDEIWGDAGLHHRLADAEELPRMPEGKLKPNGFAAGKLAQANDELEQLDGCGKCRMTGW